MNTNSKIKLIFLFTYFVYSTTYGQTRVLDVPTHTSPSGSNWCWAGCATMATQYYGNNTTECEIVEWARLNISSPNRGTNNCCSFPTPDSCFGGTAIANIDAILGSEGLSCSRINNTVTLGTVQSTINDNRPIIIQGERNFSFHTMIIIGYDGNYLHYNDPAGGSYITLYSDAITYNCMGMFSWRWQYFTHILTDLPCPVYLNLTEKIDADANISAQSEINISCEIGSNRNLTLTAGNGIIFNSGFSFPSGSTMEANVVTNPCQ